MIPFCDGMIPPVPSPTGDILFAFLSIVLEGAPYLLLGTLISGFIDAYLPSNAMDRLLPRRPIFAILVAGLLGGFFPVCECAVVPVIRRLLKKGLPLSCAVTYMLSAPIINPVVVLSTLSAFKGQNPVFMTCSRLLMAYVVTVIIGFIVSRLRVDRVLRDHVLADGETTHSHAHGSHDQRVTHALRVARTDFLDTAMYFVIGVLITSVFNTRLVVLPQAQGAIGMLSGNDALAIPGLMTLAFVLSLCSTTDAFIAASLAGFSWVARLAFLVFGPMADLKLIFLYSSVFKKAFVARLILGLLLLVALLSVAWKYAAPPLLNLIHGPAL